MASDSVEKTDGQKAKTMEAGKEKMWDLMSWDSPWVNLSTVKNLAHKKGQQTVRTQDLLFAVMLGERCWVKGWKEKDWGRQQEARWEIVMEQMKPRERK